MTGLLWRDWQDEPTTVRTATSGIIDEAVAFLAAEAIAFLETSGQFQHPLNCYWRDIRRLEAVILSQTPRLALQGRHPGRVGT